MAAETARDCPSDQAEFAAALAEFAGALAGPAEPGLAIGVYADGELVASAAAGCALPEHGVPVTGQTAFDIASVSKHMTAACLLLLARDGVADLDADIRAVLPELALASPVTLRQCLTHTSGLRDYFALCDIAGIGVLGITENRFLDLAAGQVDLDFPAGSAFSYSNTGYALAAAVVRRLTGTGLAEFAASRMFGPLGMARTHFRDDVSLLVPGLAGGYVAAAGGSGFRRYDVTEEVVGDGAVVTTLRDLAGWHAFMASGAVLGADIRDGLFARQVLTDGTRIGYALGLESVDVSGQPGWWHSGSWAGYRAAVIYLPGLRRGISVLANRNDRYASHVALAVATALAGGGDLAAAYRELGGIPAAAEAATERAREVAGLWHEPDQDVFRLLRADGDQLVEVQSGDELRYTLGTDGAWHGVGTAGGSRFTARDGELVAGWGLSSRPDGRYRRPEPGPDGSSARPAMSGIYRNTELRAHAQIRAGETGAAEIVIGLAAPRRLEPTGDGAWIAAPGAPGQGALTVRPAQDGTALLISEPGARRVRFARVPAPAAGPEPMRGLGGSR